MGFLGVLTMNGGSWVHDCLPLGIMLSSALLPCLVQLKKVATSGKLLNPWCHATPLRDLTLGKFTENMSKDETHCVSQM